MNEPQSIRVLGMTALDRVTLGKIPGVTFSEVEIPDRTHGEVVTLVAIIAPLAIPALAAYFLKKHEGETFEEHIEVTAADGTVIKRTIRYRKDASTSPDAEVIKQLRGE